MARLILIVFGIICISYLIINVSAQSMGGMTPELHKKLLKDDGYAWGFFLYVMLPFSIIFGSFTWYFFIHRWKKKENKN